MEFGGWKSRLGGLLSELVGLNTVTTGAAGFIATWSKTSELVVSTKPGFDDPDSPPVELAPGLSGSKLDPKVPISGFAGLTAGSKLTSLGFVNWLPETGLVGSKPEFKGLEAGCAGSGGR